MIQEITNEAVKEMTTSELEKALEDISSSSDYYGKWRVKEELKRRRTIARVNKDCNNSCNDCVHRLLCSLSSSSALLAGNKVTMKLNFSDLVISSDDNRGNRPKKCPIYCMPSIRASFHFSSLDRNGSYVSARVYLYYRLLPTKYNDVLKKYEAISLNELPKTQLEYDQYEMYYAQYDNPFTQIAVIAGYGSSAEDLSKMKCPILLEYTVQKVNASFNYHNYQKFSIKQAKWEEKTNPITEALAAKGNDTYKILSFAMLKKHGLFTPINTDKVAMTKKDLKMYEKMFIAHDAIPYTV